MEIVLTQNVESLGSTGTVVRVKSGYARNYLFPNSLAVRATQANLKLVADIARREVVEVDKIKGELGELAQRLGKVSLSATVTVGEEDKVFGSVTTQIISDLLKENGFEIYKKDILLDEPLKALGEYAVDVKLGHGVTGTVTVWVVKA